MDNAHIIAKILGPTMVIFGIWFLSCKGLVMEMAKSGGKAWGFHSVGLLYIIVGLTSITLFNVWQWNIYLAVTLIGWVIFIRGITFLFVFEGILYLRNYFIFDDFCAALKSIFEDNVKVTWLKKSTTEMPKRAEIKFFLKYRIPS